MDVFAREALAKITQILLSQRSSISRSDRSDLETLLFQLGGEYNDNSSSNLATFAMYSARQRHRIKSKDSVAQAEPKPEGNVLSDEESVAALIEGLLRLERIKKPTQSWVALINRGQYDKLDHDFKLFARFFVDQNLRDPNLAERVRIHCQNHKPIVRDSANTVSPANALQLAQCVRKQGVVALKVVHDNEPELAKRLLVPWGTEAGSDTQGQVELVNSYSKLLVDSDIIELMGSAVRWSDILSQISIKIYRCYDRFERYVVQPSQSEMRDFEKWKRTVVKCFASVAAHMVGGFIVAPFKEIFGSWLEGELNTAGPMSTQRSLKVHEDSAGDHSNEWKAGKLYIGKHLLAEGLTRATMGVADDLGGQVTGRVSQRVVSAMKGLKEFFYGKDLVMNDDGDMADLLNVIKDHIFRIIQAVADSLREVLGQKLDDEGFKKRKSLALADAVAFSYGRSLNDWEAYGESLFRRNADISMAQRTRVLDIIKAIRAPDVRDCDMNSLARIVDTYLLASLIRSNSGAFLDKTTFGRNYKLPRAVAKRLYELGWSVKGTEDSVDSNIYITEDDTRLVVQKKPDELNNASKEWVIRDWTRLILGDSFRQGPMSRWLQMWVQYNFHDLKDGKTTQPSPNERALSAKYEFGYNLSESERQRLQEERLDRFIMTGRYEAWDRQRRKM